MILGRDLLQELGIILKFSRSHNTMGTWNMESVQWKGQISKQIIMSMMLLKTALYSLLSNFKDLFDGTLFHWIGKK
jgi:hypothetical protein